MVNGQKPLPLFTGDVKPESKPTPPSGGKPPFPVEVPPPLFKAIRNPLPGGNHPPESPPTAKSPLMLISFDSVPVATTKVRKIHDVTTSYCDVRMSM